MTIFHVGALAVVLDDAARIHDVRLDAAPLLRTPTRLTLTEFERGEAAELDVECGMRRLDECALAWQVTLSNRAARRRELTVWLDLPLAPGFQLFCPASLPRPDPHEAVRFGFRASGEPITIPFATLYNRTAGLTLFADLDLPIRPFQVIQSHDDGHCVSICRPHVRLEPEQTLTLELGLVAHEGDWRPGLGYLTQRYRDVFFTDFPRADDYYGAFMLSSLAPDDLMDRWVDEGVKAVEVHYTYPYFGKIAPGDQPYTRAADDWWAYAKRDPDPARPAESGSLAEILAYIERAAPKNCSQAEVRRMIAGVRVRGMRSLIYYNPHDCWNVLARGRYAESIVRGRDGALHVDWFEQHILNARPDAEWGRHVRAEFRRLLNLYPAVDGVFMDQFTFDQLDFSPGADDGWSIEDGRVAYRMGHAECLLAAELAQHTRGRGKFLWWNGPYSADIARFADGMMAEGGGVQGERIQYLTVGNKPTCCAVLGEYQYKRNLTLGLWPIPPSFTFAWQTLLGAVDTTSEWVAPDDVRDLYERYRPLFEQLRGKTWLLTAQPVSAPPGIETNAFCTPDGNTLVTLTVMDQALRSRAMQFVVPVALRLPQSDAVRAVYALTSDAIGLTRLPFQRDGELIRLSLPRLRSAAMLIAARQGAFIALQTPHAVTGERSPIDLVFNFDNWTDEVVRLQLDGAAQVALDAPPMSSQTAVVSALAVRAGERAVTDLRALAGGRLQTLRWELWIDDPLSVSWAGSPTLLAGHPGTLRVRLANNTREDMLITVAGVSEDIAVQPARTRISLPAHGSAMLAVQAECAAAGRRRMMWGVRSTNARYEAEVVMPVDVVQVAFRTRPDGSPILPLSAHLRLDMLTPTGAPDMRYPSPDGSSLQMRNRPIRLNGVMIGQVPARNNDFWRVDFTVPVPPDALAHIGLGNQVEIDPDGPGDVFAVRNLALEIELPGGTRLATRTEPREHHSQADPGATIHIGLEFDSLQRRPRLNDDWNQEPVEPGGQNDPTPR